MYYYFTVTADDRAYVRGRVDNLHRGRTVHFCVTGN